MKRKDPKDRYKVFNISLEPKLSERLAKYLLDTGKARSEVVRKCLENFLKKQQY